MVIDDQQTKARGSTLDEPRGPPLEQAAYPMTGRRARGGGAGATHIWSQGGWDSVGDMDGVDARLWANVFTGELGGISCRCPSFQRLHRPHDIEDPADCGETAAPVLKRLGLVPRGDVRRVGVGLSSPRRRVRPANRRSPVPGRW